MRIGNNTTRVILQIHYLAHRQVLLACKSIKVFMAFEPDGTRVLRFPQIGSKVFLPAEPVTISSLKFFWHRREVSGSVE